MNELDREFLDELLDGDEDFATELFEAFADSARRFSDQARLALESQDMESARHAFHTLKGSAGSVGLLKVREGARGLENQVKAAKEALDVRSLDDFDALVRSGLEHLAEYRQAM